jgi:hypothetical protein
MGTRFYDDKEALANYQKWLNQDAEQRSTAYQEALKAGNGKIKRAEVNGFFLPLSIAGGMYYPYPVIDTIAAGGGEVATALLTEIKATIITSKRIKTTLETNDKVSPIKLPRYRPARYTVRKTDGAKKNRTSRKTQYKYRAAVWDSLSQCFGRSEPDETYDKALDTVVKKGQDWSKTANQSYQVQTESLTFKG